MPIPKDLIFPVGNNVLPYRALVQENAGRIVIRLDIYCAGCTDIMPTMGERGRLLDLELKMESAACIGWETLPARKSPANPGTMRFKLTSDYEFCEVWRGRGTLDMPVAPGAISVLATVKKATEIASKIFTEEEVTEAALTIVGNSLNRINDFEGRCHVGRTVAVSMPRRSGNTTCGIAIAAKYKGALVVSSFQVRKNTCRMAKGKLPDSDIITIDKIEKIVGEHYGAVVFDMGRYTEKEVKMVLDAYDMIGIPFIFVGAQPPVDWISHDDLNRRG